MSYHLKTTLVAGALAFGASVSAHGRFEGMEANGIWYHNIASSPPPPPGLDVGWIGNELPQPGGGYQHDSPVFAASYDDPKFVCGIDYHSGTSHAKIDAGKTVALYWFGWGHNHRGPIMDYLAPCNGPCNHVADPTQLEFFKVAEMGMLKAHEIPEPDNPRYEGDAHVGIWATDVMGHNSDKIGPDGGESPPDHTNSYNSTWLVDIPANIAPGFYVLRTEIIALFGGTQYYPRCVNLEVASSGTDRPAGLRPGKLYDPKSSGITAEFAAKLDNYTIPGPPLIPGTNRPNPNLALGKDYLTARGVSVEGPAPALATASSYQPVPTSTTPAASSAPAIETTSAPYAAPAPVSATSARSEAPAASSAPANESSSAPFAAPAPTSAADSSSEPAPSSTSCTATSTATDSTQASPSQSDAPASYVAPSPSSSPSRTRKGSCRKSTSQATADATANSLQAGTSAAYAPPADASPASQSPSSSSSPTRTRKGSCRKSASQATSEATADATANSLQASSPAAYAPQADASPASQSPSPTTSAVRGRKHRHHRPCSSSMSV